MTSQTPQELHSKAQKYKSIINALEEKKAENEALLASMKEMYEAAREQGDVLEETFTKIKAIAEIISSAHIKEIESFVSMALKLVFPDLGYSFKITINDKRDTKNAEFFISETINGEEYLTPLKTNRLSGGVISVVGFVLQVYFIEFFGLSNIVFIDEGFTAISDEYLPSWFNFLETLKKMKNFIIVLVTHDERFMERADRVYYVENGKFSLIE